MSSDGTKIAVHTEQLYRGRVYIFERTGSTWSQTAEIEAEQFDYWRDDFTGASSVDKLISVTPTGTVTEAGNKLTISVAAISSEWENCPYAWRYNNLRDQNLYFKVTGFTGSTSDVRGGASIFNDGVSGGDDDEEALLVEVYNDSGTYKIQAIRVISSVLTNFSTAHTIDDPNVTPVEVRFMTEHCNFGAGELWYRQGGDWNFLQELEYGDFGILATKMAFHTRNVGTHPAGSIEFDEVAALSPQTEAIVQGLSIEGDTLAADFVELSFPPTETTDLSFSAPAASEKFGTAVELISYECDDGSTGRYIGHNNPVTTEYLVVGAPGVSGGGAVHIYELDNLGQWQFFQTLTASDRAAGDNFGTSVTKPRYVNTRQYGIGEVLLIGAPNAQIGANANAGAVYVFRRQATGFWTEAQKLSAPTPVVSGLYGTSVDCTVQSLSTPENRAIIGEPGGNGTIGQAHQYTDVTGSFVIASTDTPSDGGAGDQFGFSVSMERNATVLIGSPQHNSAAGAGYFYNWGGGGEVKITAPIPTAGDEFGYSVSNVLIGAPGSDSNKGAAYPYYRATKAIWDTLQPAYLVAGDRFGVSVSNWVSDLDNVTIGADGNGASAGFCAVYYNQYQRDYGWTHAYRLAPTTNGASDRAGAFVQMHHTYFICASPEADVGGNADAGKLTVFAKGIKCCGSGWDPSVVQIYRKSGGTWARAEQLITPVAYEGEEREHGESGGRNTIDISSDEQTLVCTGQNLISFTGDCGLVYEMSGGQFVLAHGLSYSPLTEFKPDYVSINEDGTLIIASDYEAYYENFYFSDSYDNGVVDLTTSIPNVDCSISEAAGNLTIDVDTTNNPADWDGGGVYSCPLGYYTPSIPVIATAGLGWLYRLNLSNLTGGDLANSFAGLALFDTASSDALIVEYNANTSRAYAWYTTGGGAKTAIGDIAVGVLDITFNIFYDDNTGETRIEVDGAVVGTVTLPFTPTKWGPFSRINTGTVNTCQATFAWQSSTPANSGAVFVYEKNGSWAKTQELLPNDPIEDYISGGFDYDFGWAPHYYRFGFGRQQYMSPSREWLAVKRLHDKIDVFQYSGGSYSFESRIDISEADSDYHLYGVGDGAAGANQPVILMTDGRDDGNYIYIYRRESGVWVISAEDKGGDRRWWYAAISDDGSQMCASDIFETVIYTDDGALYTYGATTFSRIITDRIFVVAKDVIKVIFSSSIAITPALLNASSYSISSLSGGSDVTVQEILPMLGKTTSSVFLRISKPSLEQQYRLTIAESVLHDPDGVDLVETNVLWTHVRTKVDSAVDGIPLMYGTKSRTNVRNILEAICISDEEIGGSQSTTTRTEAEEPLAGPAEDEIPDTWGAGGMWGYSTW
jgi:hypothetical protein